jgi:hypothetical protein
MATFVFLGSSVKFKRLLRAPKKPRITRAPRKLNTERAYNTKNAENGVWGGSHRKKSCFLQASKFYFYFLFFSEVTRHLAYVIKATSSLLPFLSASYYAATPGWSVIPAQYKTKSTTAQVWISYFHCLMSSRSG